jgi:hypothetical protein
MWVLRGIYQKPGKGLGFTRGGGNAKTVKRIGGSRGWASRRREKRLGRIVIGRDPYSSPPFLSFLFLLRLNLSMRASCRLIEEVKTVLFLLSNWGCVFGDLHKAEGIKRIG